MVLRGSMGVIGIGIPVLAFLVGSPPILAQSVCATISHFPTRGEADQRRLAVWIDDDWRYFDPNGNAPAHTLESEGLNEGLCLLWEAPPYRRHNRQIVYASTRYKDGQRLSLFRNSAVQGVPLLWRLFDDWDRDSVVAEADTFREFHRKPFVSMPDAGRNDRTPDAIRNELTLWHDTSLWLANRGSYELVSAAVADTASLPYGAERLLVLQASRPQTSWVRFETHAPSAGGELIVGVAYSGDLERLGLRIYRYTFEVGD